MLRSNLDYLATCLYEAGVHHWAVSPGSRNAPIIAGLVRHGGFQLHSFPDERCAAFAALGMAQATNNTCGVLCTSGTAVLNLYPGICEAYYQRIPILALTADRPAELIDQWDGQTIRQKEIFEKHILNSFETPQDIDNIDRKMDLQQMVFDAVKQSLSPVKGPVHINVPLRDPIYAHLDQPFEQVTIPNFERSTENNQEIPNNIFDEILSSKNILCVAGQLAPNEELKANLQSSTNNIPVLADITSNLNSIGISDWEKALQTNKQNEQLQPDILITFGLSILSKPLKIFLKKHKPKKHFHISESGFIGDPFGTQPIAIRTSPQAFFAQLQSHNVNVEYKNLWIEYTQNIPEIPELLKDFYLQKEYAYVQSLLLHADSQTDFQLGNSMTIRFASWAGKTKANIYCNRGTSGIDGTLSTAVGFAIAHPERKVICALGDISFFYDSNALWTDCIPHNLGIVVLNNHGGQIFNFISGPSSVPEIMPYVSTLHNRSVKHTAMDYNIPYHKGHFIDNPNANIFAEINTPFLLEITHE